ncbi:MULTISPECIES: alanyl-tRNA editing protein [unclassified Photobacterium]|uniref:alanyl-tRNA editing protein n=1 Tax=unclassified Photobacterium TaxID=2628852 RepID=UPI001EDD0AE4|nr:MULTISPECIES: alanyl-tRNA editing protein [unclassified Photobacterium]MCG3866063.1 alanyl-tRNA editing protein [Photobacterium sp. Ph6]MCG3877579.1 alanyl-tRNA editing protein [Photobacterium sp. Ph5]
MSAIAPTQVVFTQQQWLLDSPVMLINYDDENYYIVTQITPFHPVSHIWPDHPADQGRIIYADKAYQVNNCVVGAIELATNRLFVAQDIPVKRDTEGWVFVVVHVVTDAIAFNVGDIITLSVDSDYQQSLSRGHSAGHLSSLALNKVLHNDFWRKEPTRRDELGYYDFHSYAQEKSEVTPDLSTDTYRLGKTLRKRGLNSADLLAELNLVAERINLQLSDWVALKTAVVMRREGDHLTDSRYWQCDLGFEGIIEIPCGGTHILSLSEYQSLSVSFDVISEQNIVMYTTSVKA